MSQNYKLLDCKLSYPASSFSFICLLPHDFLPKSLVVLKGTDHILEDARTNSKNIMIAAKLHIFSLTRDAPF